MKRLSAVLEAEVLLWKQVKARRMFGMTAIYRNSYIFALLPKTRALDEPNSVGFRLRRCSQRILARMRSDERVIGHRPGAKWFSFLLDSEADVHDALAWFELAYRRAGKGDQDPR